MTPEREQELREDIMAHTAQYGAVPFNFGIPNAELIELLDAHKAQRDDLRIEHELRLEAQRDCVEMDKKIKAQREENERLREDLKTAEEADDPIWETLVGLAAQFRASGSDEPPYLFIQLVLREAHTKLEKQRALLQRCAEELKVTDKMLRHREPATAVWAKSLVAEIEECLR
jgi:hypothetical protein